jgi:hypothetical protein
LDHYRRRHPRLGESDPGANWGFFLYLGELRIISSGPAEGWEHVSVSHKSRTPSWAEMQEIKELFWSDEETVVQFHPAKAEYVNIHHNCLHLWRPTGGFNALDLPPRDLIG